MKCVVSGTNPTRSRCYCPAGSTEPKYISPGYYGSGGDNTNFTHSGQTICPKGYYCMGGVASCHSNVQCDGNKYYCPGGTYGAASGLQTNTCSGQCLAGWYCKPGSTSSQETECGYGLSIPVYCPAGSGSPKTDVGNGYTYCPITSPQGIYCTNMTREAKAPCKKDYACENGDIINVYWGGKVLSTSFGSPVQINDPRFAVGFGEVAENTDNALVKDTKVTGRSDVIRVTFGTGSSASASENRVAPFASYSILTVECVKTKALTSNAPFQFKLVDASSEGVYIYTNTSLKRTVCDKYKVNVKVVDSVQVNATALLSIEITLLNTNDAPVFNADSVADRRIVYENAIVGAVIDQTEKIWQWNLHYKYKPNSN